MTYQIFLVIEVSGGDKVEGLISGKSHKTTSRPTTEANTKMLVRNSCKENIASKIKILYFK